MDTDEILQGVMEYKRTAAYYENTLQIKDEWKNKRVFLKFEGANSVADVFVNRKFINRHKGGYTAFTVEITDYIKSGNNNILVMVSNAYRHDVLPLHGDFNVYGGLHRPVSVIVTEKNCISPLDFGSSGVYVTPDKITQQSTDIHINTKLSLQKNSSGITVKSSILDGNDKTITSTQNTISNLSEVNHLHTIKSPILWNGKKNPYLYKVRIELFENGKLIDEITENFGIRNFSIDADKGFFLNGEYLDLYGVGKHDDFYGKGSALTKKEHDTDMALMNELGATSIRLTHYPHNKYFHELSDKNGYVLWTEIPFIGPGGYTGAGYVKDKSLEESVINNTIEMVKQHYNHPSVFFWGIGNELLLNYDDPQPFLKRLDSLIKTIDNKRFTAYASNMGNDVFADVSNVLAWNKYYGWYGGSFDEIGKWANQAHKALPNKPIAVSEYGAGASPHKHTDSLQKPSAPGKFHPEEWQTAFHEVHWRELNKRPFVWGKYIWAFADFSSSIRTEGDDNGINDKGFITYDRKIKKDAFYFYKANWNKEPIIYIAEKRNNKRKATSAIITVYSNYNQVELFVNNESY